MYLLKLSIDDAGDNDAVDGDPDNDSDVEFISQTFTPPRPSSSTVPDNGRRRSQRINTVMGSSQQTGGRKKSSSIAVGSSQSNSARKRTHAQMVESSPSPVPEFVQGSSRDKL
jgi:hypothetical protein